MKWVDGNPYAMQDAVQARREREDEQAEAVAEAREMELESMDLGDGYAIPNEDEPERRYR